MTKESDKQIARAPDRVCGIWCPLLVRRFDRRRGLGGLTGLLSREIKGQQRSITRDTKRHSG